MAFNRVAILLDFDNDGNLQVGLQDTWAAAHDSATGAVSSAGSHLGGYAQYAAGKYHCQRGCLVFDTSCLAERAVVSAKIVGTTDANCNEADTGEAQLNVVEGDFGTPIATTDYGALRLKTVSGGTLDIGDISESLTPLPK